MKNLIILSLFTNLVMAGNDFFIKTEGISIRIEGNQAKISAVQRYSGIGNYYILKIKTTVNAIKSGGLIAECVQ